MAILNIIICKITYRTYTYVNNGRFGEFYTSPKNYKLLRKHCPDLPAYEFDGDDDTAIIRPGTLLAMCQLVDTLKKLRFVKEEM